MKTKPEVTTNPSHVRTGYHDKGAMVLAAAFHTAHPSWSAGVIRKALKNEHDLSKDERWIRRHWKKQLGFIGKETRGRKPTLGSPTKLQTVKSLLKKPKATPVSECDGQRTGY